MLRVKLDQLLRLSRLKNLLQPYARIKDLLFQLLANLTKSLATRLL